MVLKIAVFADSHHTIDRMLHVLHRTPVDAVFHLGDCVDDATDLSYCFPSLPFYCVSGNNDFAHLAPYQMQVTIERVPILLTHGHQYPASVRVEKLAFDARQAGAKLVFFGHTHSPHRSFVGDIFIANPGSIEYPRRSLPSWILLTTHGDGTFSVDLRIVDESL